MLTVDFKNLPQAFKMSSISQKPVIDKIIQNLGRYEGDPQIFKIWKYTNAWGGTCFKVTYDPNFELESSRFIVEPALYWSFQEAVQKELEKMK
jgi:hypothetical protein